jgi:predicted RND superfamily exporter protein
MFYKSQPALYRKFAPRGVFVEKFFKHPWGVVGVITLITVFFALQLPQAEIDNDMNGFVPDDNEVQIISENIKDLFGEEIGMFVGLERKYGTVFDQAFLARIRDFTDVVEQIPIVKEVTSILSMPYITADGDSIFVTDLVDEDFTGTPDEIAELKRRLASWDLYQGSTVSENFAATQIVVSLNISMEDLRQPEVEADIKEIRTEAEKTFSSLAAVYLTGEPVMTSVVNDYMRTDLVVLIPLVLVVVLAVLFFSFHRFTFVALPLLTVVVSVIWAIGAMPLLGFKLTMLSIILPIILIAVGSAYGIHVVTHYLHDTKDKIFTADEHRALVFTVLRKVFKPVLLAALTTMAGFVSFCFTWLSPMRDFGYFSCFGTAVSFVIAVTLIPALLLIRGPRRQKTAKQAGQKKASRLDTLLADIFSAVAARKGIVLIITVVVAVFSVYGLTKLVVDNSMVEFFREDSDISRSDRFIRNYFGGSAQVNVVVEADSTETLFNPVVLSSLDNLSAYLTERVPYVGKVSGFTDMIKRMNQMFNVDEPLKGVRKASGSGAAPEDVSGEFGFGSFGEFGNFGEEGREYEETGIASVSDVETDETSRTAPALSDSVITFAMLDSALGRHTGMTADELVREIERQTNYEGRAYYEIPSDPARYGKRDNEELARLIMDYLVLVSGDTDGGYANDPLEPTAIRSSIQISSQWQKDTNTVVDAANEYIAANFPKNVKVTVGGGSTVIGELTNLVMKSQILSIFISILVVFVIIALANRSIVAGILAAVPISLAILCNFGIMGIAGITLNVATALIASLAVGIGIDYTIHFMEFFKGEYLEGGDFLKRTFAGCGKAIIINAVSVGGGFAVLLFSQFRMLAEFGGLIALNMLVTAIVSLTVMPVLFTLIKPKFIYGNNSASR